LFESLLLFTFHGGSLLLKLLLLEFELVLDSFLHEFGLGFLPSEALFEILLVKGVDLGGRLLGLN